MSETSEIVNDCLTHYNQRHIQVRWDYFTLCVYNPDQYNQKVNDKGHVIKDEPNQECMAKILRIMETLTDAKRLQWHIDAKNAREKGLTPPQEPKEWPIELAYEAIVELLYHTFGENIVRNSVAVLLERGYIKRYQAGTNTIPIYYLNIPLVQTALKKQAENALEGVESNTHVKRRKKVLKVTPNDSKVTPKSLKVTPEGVENKDLGSESNTNNIDNNNSNNTDNNPKRESPPNTLDTHTIVSSDTAHAELSHCFFCPKPQTATCFECGKPVCSEHGTHYYGDMLWCDLCLDVVEVVDEKPQGDDHATASGHPHRVGEPATRGGDSGHGTVDNGQVATPEAGPVLEAQKEIAQTPTTTMPAQSLPLPQDAQAALGTHTRTRKPAQPKPETPKGPPAEPPADMAWGTRKCLLWFDYWRGGILIGKWKLMQASTCAKGLAEQFDEQMVIQVRTDMEADPYYAAKGGCDVCDVANNIHKYLKKRHNKQKPQSPNVDSATSEPLLSVEEEFGRYWGINEKRVNEKRGVSYATA